jgi:hypothetical protein
MVHAVEMLAVAQTVLVALVALKRSEMCVLVMAVSEMVDAMLQSAAKVVKHGTQDC